MERDAQGLAEEIPARDLDPADRGDVHLVGREVPGAGDLLRQRGNAEGIFAHDESLELLQGPLDGQRAQPQRRLAEPAQALVRLDDDEEPVLPRIPHEDGPQIGDLHEARLLFTPTGRVARS